MSRLQLSMSQNCSDVVVDVLADVVAADVIADVVAAYVLADVATS